MASDKVIEVCDVDLNESEIDSIIKKWQGNKVEWLKLRRCRLNVDSLKRIIETQDELCGLEVSGSGIGSELITEIYSNSRCLPSLLILNGVELGDEGVELLLPHLDSIESLSLESNNITSSGAMKLFNSLTGNIRSLSLANNLLDDSVVFSITPSLKSLDLSGNKFSYRGLQILCRNLGQGKIETLKLNGMKFASVSDSIGWLYTHNSSIKELYLRDCALKRIPKIESTKLEVLDITGNIVPRFEAPKNLQVIGNTSYSTPGKKVSLKFDGFEDIRKQVDELGVIGEAVDSTGEIAQELSEVSELMAKLNAKLMGIRRKVKGRRPPRSLSSYAAKLMDSNDAIDFSEFCDSSASGITLECSFSRFTKIQILLQYLSFVQNLSDRSIYVKEFRPSAFLWTDDSRLVLKDQSLLGYAKTDSGVHDFMSKFMSFDPLQIPKVHSLIIPSLSVKSQTVYSCERNMESVLNMFRSIDSSQLMASFHVAITGETAVDHGGVLRDVLTDFWAEASVSMFEMSDTAVSLLPKEGDFRTIGRIMVKCLIECIPAPIPIHSIVFRFLCDQLPKTLSEWIGSVAEFDPQLAATIGYEAESDVEICERCKELLIGRRKEALLDLKQGFLELPVINCLTKNMLDWWTLSNEFTGEAEWTGEQLVEQITFVGYFGHSNAKSIWMDVIKSFSKSDISHFIRLLTGIGSIPAGGFVSRGKRLVVSLSDRFFAHTCSFELESPLFENHAALAESLQIAFTSLDLDNSMNEWYRKSF